MNKSNHDPLKAVKGQIWVKLSIYGQIEPKSPNTYVSTQNFAKNSNSRLFTANKGNKRSNFGQKIIELGSSLSQNICILYKVGLNGPIIRSF